MYLLAHAGITLGTAYAIEKAANCGQGGPDKGSQSGREPLRFDFRFILLGALLPDIIDKPLGYILLPEALANGRTFLHTLVFLMVTLLAAFIIYWRNRELSGAYIAFGVLMHFVMDAIWTDPVTFFWPFLGPFLSRPGITFSWVLQSWVQSLIGEARLYMPEIAGFLILLFFAARAVLQRKVTAFIRQGSL